MSVKKQKNSRKKRNKNKQLDEWKSSRSEFLFVRVQPLRSIGSDATADANIAIDEVIENCSQTLLQYSGYSNKRHYILLVYNMA